MKTILSIFAGRYKYLSILKNYLDFLLNKEILTEVHLWNFARQDTDYVYVISIADNDKRYKLFTPNKESIQKNWNQWAEYYDYYMNCDDFDILIKCDDDIVFIDVDKMQEFIYEIKDDSLYFPNIVNNDVCAYIQTANRVHDLVLDVDINLMTTGCTIPLTGWEGWYKQPDKALEIHKLFLEDRSKFSIDKPNISWDSRISINMFAGTKNTIKKYFSLFKQIGKGDDEAFFSSVVCKFMNTTNYIVPYFNIVHFSFGPQLSDNLDAAFVNKYYDLSCDISNSHKHILFILTGNNHRNGIVDGKSIRTGGIGCSGTEQSMIILAEFLAKNNFKIYIANNYNNYEKLKKINNVYYTNYELNNIATKHFDYVITYPWIDDTLIKIPIFGTVKKIILWMQTIYISNVKIIHQFMKERQAKLYVINPSVYISRIINHDISQSIIPNPIINLQNIQNKQKHKIIFFTCWERGGVYAQNIFNALNWSDGTFCIFDYDTTSKESQIVDKQELYQSLATAEYFIYPLLNHKTNAIHKPVFSSAIAEALLNGVITITLPVRSIKDSFNDTVVYIDNNDNNDNNDNIDIFDNYKILISEDEYEQLNQNIVKMFKLKIEQIDNNQVLKEQIIKKGILFAETLIETNIDTDIGKKWMEIIK